MGLIKELPPNSSDKSSVLNVPYTVGTVMPTQPVSSVSPPAPPLPPPPHPYRIKSTVKRAIKPVDFMHLTGVPILTSQTSLLVKAKGYPRLISKPIRGWSFGRVEELRKGNDEARW